MRYRTDRTKYVPLTPCLHVDQTIKIYLAEFGAREGTTGRQLTPGPEKSSNARLLRRALPSPRIARRACFAIRGLPPGARAMGPLMFKKAGTMFQLVTQHIAQMAPATPCTRDTYTGGKRGAALALNNWVNWIGWCDAEYYAPNATDCLQSSGIAFANENNSIRQWKYRRNSMQAFANKNRPQIKLIITLFNQFQLNVSVSTISAYRYKI